MSGKLKDKDVPKTSVPAYTDYSKILAAVNARVKQISEAAVREVANYRIFYSTAIITDPDTGKPWNGEYPEDLHRLTLQGLGKYLTMSSSEMIRLSEIDLSLSTEIKKRDFSTDFLESNLVIDTKGPNAEHRKKKAEIHPQLLEERASLLYYLIQRDYARWGHKVHELKNKTISRLISIKELEQKTLETGAAKLVEAQPYRSPLTRTYPRFTQND